MANHGTVSFGETVEKAYWWTEILDAYCRILMLAKDLGRVHYFDREETRELLDLKQKWGYADRRLDTNMDGRDTYGDEAHRAGWNTTGELRTAFDPPPPMGADPRNATRPTLPPGLDYETLVRVVTEQVCKQLGIART
jgi:L-fuculose-phosphate aldolase